MVVDQGGSADGVRALDRLRVDDPGGRFRLPALGDADLLA
jgi:hypothetical protein